MSSVTGTHFSASHSQDSWEDNYDSMLLGNTQKIYGRNEEIEELENAFLRIRGVLATDDNQEGNPDKEEEEEDDDDDDDTDKNSNIHPPDNNMNHPLTSSLPRRKKKKKKTVVLSDTGFSEIVLLHGPSGTGKTKLVEAALRNYAPTHGGLLIGGKFDQLQMRGESFSALSAALSDLCDALLSTRPPAELHQLQQELLQELGSDVHTLQTLIPHLQFLLPNMKRKNSHSSHYHFPTNNYNEEEDDEDDENDNHNNEGVKIDKRNDDTTKTASSVVGKRETDENTDESSLSSSSSSQGVPESGKQAFTRLKQLCCAFLRMVSSPGQPLALFIDDLQWADPASLEMLQAIATFPSSKHILLIGAFRDDDETTTTQEESAATPRMNCKGFVRSLRDRAAESGISSSDLRLTVLEIGHLDVDGINKMVVALTGCEGDDDETEEFCRLVYQKTNGNAYFVDQFLELLQRNNMMYRENGTWRWNLERIQSETNVADNVVQLVAGKIESLPPDMQDALKLASFLGYRFQLRMLQLLWDQVPASGASGSSSNNNNSNSNNNSSSSSDMSVSDDYCQDSQGDGGTLGSMDAVKSQRGANLSDLLRQAVEYGLLERNGKHQYKFSHDRVQQCLFSMVKEGHERTWYHLQIGRVLSSTPSQSSPEKHPVYTPVKGSTLVVVVTDHLNLGSSLMKDAAERLQLVRWNLSASKWTLRQSAFGPSAEYLRRGLAILNQLQQEKSVDKWVTQYSLTLQVYSMLGHLEFCNGRYNDSNDVCKEILLRAKSLHDKLEAYGTMVRCLNFQKGRLQDAIQLGISVLALLGETLPKRPKVWHVVGELIKARKALRGLGDSDLLNLPHMQDKNKIAAVNVMRSMVGATFFDEDSKLYYALISLRLMTLMCRYGNTAWSPAIVAQYGGMEAAVGNIAGAKRFLFLSNSLIGKSKSKQARNRGLGVLHAMLSQWYQPYSVALHGTRQNYVLGMECGDFEYALYGANQYICIAMLSDMGLTQVENDVRIFCQQMQDFNLETILMITLPLWQAVLNLLGEAEKNDDDPAILSGEVMNQQDFEISLARGTHTLAKQVFVIFRARLAVYFGRWHQMEEMFAPFVAGRDKSLKGHFSNFEASFWEGYLSYKLYQRLGQRKYLRQARTTTRRLDDWVKEGVPDCVPPFMLLQAESVVAQDKQRNRLAEALQHYEDAVQAAKVLGVLQWEALFNERAYEVVSTVYNDPERAMYYLDRAALLYERWEAYGKVEHMKQSLRSRYFNR